MPRYNSKKRDYTVGEYWLSQQHRSKAWCRTWYDAKTRQTKRASLGTDNFEEAKARLDDWFTMNRTMSHEKQEDIMLADILARYWEQHAKHLPSADRSQSAIKHWLEFYGDEPLSFLQNITNQEKFHQYLKDRNMKPTSIGRVIVAGKAAINRAWKRGEIENVPYIMNVGAKEARSAEPKGRPLEISDIVQFYEACNQDTIRIFTMLMIATGARPDAIYQLTMDRCDIDNGLIDLNPEGRIQNNKYRPTVKMPQSIIPMLTTLKHSKKQSYAIEYRSNKVRSLRIAWRTARMKAQLDGKVQPYSIRHTMARWLRKQSVPSWEVSAQLGHSQRDMAITEIYAPHDPAYLGASCKAIDVFFDELRVKCVGIDNILNGYLEQ